MQEYNYKIDSFKFLAVIAVVFIHLTAFLWYEHLATFFNYYSYRNFLNIGVPFFFVCSGYLLSRKAASSMKNYSKKIFLMYISFSILYIALEIAYIISDRLLGKGEFWSKLNERILNYQVSNFINGEIGKYHLWFLAALFTSVLMLHGLIHFKTRPKIIFLISFVTYGLFMAGRFDLGNIVVNGGFIAGFFYVSMGYYVGNVDAIRIKNPLIFFILFFIAYDVFAILGFSEIKEFILACATFFLLIYCIQKPGKPSLFSKLGKHSLAIYVLHVFFIEAFYKVLGYLGITGFNKNPLNIILLAVLCIGGSILLFKPTEILITNTINRIVDMIINPEKKVKQD